MVEAPGVGGTLYVVATPIGNLGDISLRALEILRTVPLAAAEDTRIARRLWARYDIATRLVSYHARSGTRRHGELIEHLRSGNDLALVSDAGTPLVSDPGGELVADWLALGGATVPIPGASAVLAALVVSGFAAPRWAFEGFLPRSGGERRVRLARIASDERATVLFESARRAGATLTDLAEVCATDRRAALTRELTKIHEETWRGTVAELATRAAGVTATRRGDDRGRGRGPERRRHCLRPVRGRGSGRGRSTGRRGVQPVVRRPPGCAGAQPSTSGSLLKIRVCTRRKFVMRKQTCQVT